MQTKLALSQPVAVPRISLRRLPARRQACKPVAAMPNTQLVICASTAACLALGRFVFLPFQRDQQERAGQQPQGGEGGDIRIQVRTEEFPALSAPATTGNNGNSPFLGCLLIRAWHVQVQPFAVQSNDPAGFTLVDVLAWGSIGHAIA